MDFLEISCRCPADGAAGARTGDPLNRAPLGWLLEKSAAARGDRALLPK
ncbi:hypothetical protein [Sphingomonas sp. BK235]|nr:hypothetical protein [Sphingomonas sp. BK235]